MSVPGNLYTPTIRKTRGPNLQTIPDSWILNYASLYGGRTGGVLDPSGYNQGMGMNLGLTGDFILSWNWSALGSSAQGMSIGVAPWGPPGMSDRNITTNYESGVPTNDWININDRAVSNNFRLMQDGYYPADVISGRTLATLQFRRTANIFTLTYEDGTVIYTFGGASTGAVLAIGTFVSSDTNNTRMENIQYADNL